MARASSAALIRRLPSLLMVFSSPVASPPLQPRPQPFHRFSDIRRGARIAEADEASALHRIEIRAGGCGDARFLQHAAGEIEAVAAKARHVRIEIEGAVDRQELVESGAWQAFHEQVPVDLVAVLDR